MLVVFVNVLIYYHYFSVKVIFITKAVDAEVKIFKSHALLKYKLEINLNIGDLIKEFKVCDLKC